MITTFTRRVVDPLNLQEKDICIEDIAHALALCNRFAGHTRMPISVAQHCCFVAEICEGDYEIQALLHDASEAYLGDVTKWVKHAPLMSGYREAEERAQRAIYRRFGCQEEMHPCVERADKLMVRVEAYYGYGTDHSFSRDDYPPLSKEEKGKFSHWVPWNWMDAEREFLYLARFFGIK